MVDLFITVTDCLYSTTKMPVYCSWPLLTLIAEPLAVVMNSRMSVLHTDHSVCILTILVCVLAELGDRPHHCAWGRRGTGHARVQRWRGPATPQCTGRGTKRTVSTMEVQTELSHEA